MKRSIGPDNYRVLWYGVESEYHIHESDRMIDGLFF